MSNKMTIAVFEDYACTKQIEFPDSENFRGILRDWQSPERENSFQKPAWQELGRKLHSLTPMKENNPFDKMWSFAVIYNDDNSLVDDVRPYKNAVLSNPDKRMLNPMINRLFLFGCKDKDRVSAMFKHSIVTSRTLYPSSYTQLDAALSHVRTTDQCMLHRLSFTLEKEARTDLASLNDVVIVNIPIDYNRSPDFKSPDNNFIEQNLLALNLAESYTRRLRIENDDQHRDLFYFLDMYDAVRTVRDLEKPERVFDHIPDQYSYAKTQARKYIKRHDALTDWFLETHLVKR